MWSSPDRGCEIENVPVDPILQNRKAKMQRAPQEKTKRKIPSCGDK